MGGTAGVGELFELAEHIAETLKTINPVSYTHLDVYKRQALIRTFKKMKDYILENRDLIGQREILQLSMETANNRIEINKINSDMISLEKQISDVAEGLKDVVTKSELADMMNSFVSDDDEKWLMFNAKFSSADEVYETIYKQAKSSRCV